MRHDIIARLEGIVEGACRRETNVYGYAIWTHHIAPVVANVRRLAPHLGADLEVVTVAGILHDYASVCDAALADAHHEHGAADARRLLAAMGYPPERTALVAECILSHRGSVRLAQASAEAVCLAGADALTHFEQVPSLLYMVYAERGMGIDEGAAWVRAKLARSWAKMDPRVQALVEPLRAAGETLLAPADRRGTARE